MFADIDKLYKIKTYIVGIMGMGINVFKIQ